MKFKQCRIVNKIVTREPHITIHYDDLVKLSFILLNTYFDEEKEEWRVRRTDDITGWKYKNESTQWRHGMASLKVHSPHFYNKSAIEDNVFVVTSIVFIVTWWGGFIDIYLRNSGKVKIITFENKTI